MGTYTFSVELRNPHAKTTGTMWALDKSRPLAVVDIDGTISNLAEWRVAFQGGRAPAYADSPQLLRDLARTHQIVYLTARDDTFDPQTRAATLRARLRRDGVGAFSAGITGALSGTP
jgi:phosphatidate phosphatase PAH1